MNLTKPGFVNMVSMLLKAAMIAVCFLFSGFVMCSFVLESDGAAVARQIKISNHAIMERYDMFINNTLSDSLEGVLAIKKNYWLNDDELVAPEPNPECYGTAKSPEELQQLLEDAADLLDGQDTLFSMDTPVWEEDDIYYYLDDTILVITWKQVIDGSVYTISEVKIADASQFRRFLADGEYASGAKYVPTELASSVNAVVAANGDFYTFRDMGIIVYNSQLMRAEGKLLDTCFVAGNGDLLMVHRKEIMEEADMQQFVEENDVRFSVAFGPILVENGQPVEIKNPYPMGEVGGVNARAALCQRDELHYYLVTVSKEPPHRNGQSLGQFAKRLAEMGSQSAYNLDGGQSATIVMDDEVINYVWERQVSDIIYFATAIPDGE